MASTVNQNFGPFRRGDTIDDVDQFTITAHQLDIAGANHQYDCQITFQGSKVKTYFAGVWQVVEDITKAAALSWREIY